LFWSKICILSKREGKKKMWDKNRKFIENGKWGAAWKDPDES